MKENNFLKIPLRSFGNFYILREQNIYSSMDNQINITIRKVNDAIRLESDNGAKTSRSSHIISEEDVNTILNILNKYVRKGIKYTLD